MKSEFEMSEWTEGESDFILNIRIDRDWEAGAVKISQDRGSLPFEQNGPKEDIDDLGVVVRICPL